MGFPWTCPTPTYALSIILKVFPSLGRMSSTEPKGAWLEVMGKLGLGLG